MKISLNTIRGLNRRYECAADIAPEGAGALAKRIGAQLGAIEEIIDFGDAYEGVLIVYVVSCTKHPNADKLNVCLIDDGGKAQDVERNAEGLVQVVCGAPNVRDGLTVAWLPPGSTVPESYGKDPFVLGARELRGVVSNGMLASARELALGDSHDGILEIDGDIAPGTGFVQQFELSGDKVIDIENKMFTHRPDCFGFLGVSRELAGIQHMPFKSPAWYRTDAEIPGAETEPLPLTVRNEIPELVPRFTAITLREVEVKSSPVWLQVELTKHGLRPINNIVDYTNFFMLETGQPIHAYDYDKVKALSSGDSATIVVRFPHDGENIALLNGKTITPRAGAMMVATDQKLICVGGAIGGSDTEVDEKTRNVIIEAANWDMYELRRTAMEHGIFTDAVARFTKGQSPLQNRAVLAKIVDEIRRFAGGKIAGELIDDNHVPAEVMERGSVHLPVSLTAAFINERLGLQLSADEIASLLTNVEFDVQGASQTLQVQTNAAFKVELAGADGGMLTVKAPFWRTDIEIPEDIVEEVGRLYGFDHLPLELPKRAIVPAAKNGLLELKQRLRDALSKAGANEVLGYSFVHGKLLERAGQNLEDAFKLSNALSPDLQYYRVSLTPSLLDKVHQNIKAGYDEFALFEIGKAHMVGKMDDEGLPSEFERLALVFAAAPRTAKTTGGAAFYQAKRYAGQVLAELNVTGNVVYQTIDADEGDVSTAYYMPGRSATISIDGEIIGRIGEYRPGVAKSMKLPEYCAGFELGLSPLSKYAKPDSRYVPLSRFPKVEQDLCLRVPVATTYATVYDFVSVELARLQPENAVIRLSPLDIYQRQDDTDFKQITLRLNISHYDKTLRDSEVTAMLDTVADAAKAGLDAVRV